jgi:hypothetical protein
MKFSILIGVMPIALIISALFGCDDRYETIQPPGAFSPKLAPVQALIPVIRTDKTRVLFGLADKVNLGNKVGIFELRKEGILIHPGETSPTKVSFKLSRGYQKLIVRPFIATLPADATAVKEAGTVGVEFLLDGKSEGRLLVDRDSTYIKTLDLTNADILTVVVDNGDGKAWFDWLMLGVVDSK